ncbi:hypothetical protein HGM15179_003280, partial [Zosterops borbonicus]
GSDVPGWFSKCHFQRDTKEPLAPMTTGLLLPGAQLVLLLVGMATYQPNSASSEYGK